MATLRYTETAVIPASGTTSGTITVQKNKTLIGIRIPAAMTGTSLSFRMGVAGSTVYELIYRANTLYSFTVPTAGPARWEIVDHSYFAAAEFIQIVSNATEAAQRSFTLQFGEI